MKRIKQIEETKKMISDALLRLLKSTSLDKITVSDITKEARIGRNTFYSHFKKKEDILTYLMQDFRKELEAKFEQEEMPSPRALLVWRFNLLKDNQLLTVFNNYDELKQLFYNFRDKDTPLYNFPTTKNIYIRDFILGGIDSITCRWITNGMKESPDEMADKILSIRNI